MRPFNSRRGFSLLELLIAFILLLVAVLTLVGYTATVHRASTEGKRQALASVEARSMLERIRDFPGAFEQARQPDGLLETKTEHLLNDEDEDSDNEVGRKAAMQFTVQGKVTPIDGEVHRVVVTVEWQENGRPRSVSLESALIAIGR